MASKRIKADRLGEEIDKIMKDYSDNISSELDEITKKIGRKGATAIKNEAHEKFNGDQYYKGWTVSTVKWPHYTSVIIHNKDHYQLAHLLEHGHAKVGGGRVEGRAHIAPVEESLMEEYERTVVSRLKNVGVSQ